MAAGIRLPGFPGSSSFPYLSPLSLGAAYPVPLAGAAVSPHGQPPQGAPTATPQSFPLQFPPTPSSILSLSPSHADPGSSPKTSFGSPTHCHPFVYFHIVPFQRFSTSVLECGLCVLPHILYPVRCCSFPSLYYKLLPQVLPYFGTTLIHWHYLHSVFVVLFW